MAKYGPKAKRKVGEVMQEFKQGALRSGTGAKVTNPRQAVAIGLAEARREGDRVPPPPAKAERPAARSRAGKSPRGR